jgi:hypothetical protein
MGPYQDWAMRKSGYPHPHYRNFRSGSRLCPSGTRKIIFADHLTFFIEVKALVKTLFLQSPLPPQVVSVGDALTKTFLNTTSVPQLLTKKILQ